MSSIKHLLMSRIFKIVIAIFLTMIFLLNVSFYIFSNIQYQNEIDRQFNALYTMTVHLSTEDNDDALVTYLAHYTHINDVIIHVTDMNQEIIFSNDSAGVLVNRHIVYDDDTPVGYLSVSFESSTLGKDITYGFIGLNIISLSLFLIGIFILYHYLKKESYRIDCDLENIENPNQTIKYKEIYQLQKKLQVTNDQKHKQKRIYEAHIKRLAHDIKTPLSVIQIYTESLSLKKIELTDEICMDLHEETKRIEKLIPKFIEANYTELPYQQDISMYIQSYVNRYHDIFETKKVHLIADLEPLLVTISDRDLERLIEHITFNAFYYSKQQSKVSIITRHQKRQLIIEDEGIGMTQETIDKIKQGSYRSDEAKLLNEKGSGIGYQIIMDIISRLHAHIDIQSEIGKKTRVKITFPTE